MTVNFLLITYNKTVLKLSEASIINLYLLAIWLIFFDVNFLLKLCSSIFGLIFFNFFTAVVALSFFISLVSKITWRDKLEISILSLSIIPIFPIPNADKYKAIGEPRPPAPTISTLLLSNLVCPPAPIFF